jgi:membrane protein
VKDFWHLLVTAFWRWWDDNTFRLGAALAYYTVFSIAPIILIAIGIASLFFDRQTAQDQIIAEISTTVGPEIGKAIGDNLNYTSSSGSTTWATIVAIIVLLVGATSVFAQLQDALNTIWGVKAKPDRPWWGALKDRFWSFTLVLGTGFLLLVSLVVSAALTAVARFIVDGMTGAVYVGMGLNWILSLGVITLLFAMIYKVLPDVRIAWGDVWIGAFLTALLFNIGKYLISLYLGQSTWINAYGAAGSLIVILLWVYYSSQILLYGAEFTSVYANREGKRIRPIESAEAVTAEARARQGLPRHSPVAPERGKR